MRYRILRGMNRLAASPVVGFDPGLLRSATDATMSAVFRLVHWRSVLEQGAKARPGRSTPGHDLLVQLLRDKEEQAIERLFRLLGLRHRDEDLGEFQLGVPGAHNMLNATAAVAIGLELMIAPDAIRQALAQREPAAQDLVRSGGGLAATRTLASACAPAWTMIRTGSYSLRAAAISAEFAPLGSVSRKTCCHGEATQTTGS